MALSSVVKTCKVHRVNKFGIEPSEIEPRAVSLICTEFLPKILAFTSV
nr:MAG TPA: hypothetical protein [Caudoviricetes sp.]